MATATFLRISSASRAGNLCRALNCLRLIKFGKSAIMQAMTQKLFAIEAERFGRNAKSYNLKVGKFGNNTTSRYISEFINTISGEILADTENSNEIRYEVAHKR